MQESLPQSNPLRQIVQTWVKKLKAAEAYKKPFNDDAKEASSFFDGDHNWMWKDAYARGERGYNSSIAPPSFRMQLNKVFELVEIFAMLSYRNQCELYLSWNTREVYTMGLPENPDPMQETTPEQQQLIGVVAAELEQKKQRKLGAELLEHYLNWTPVELDLKRQARMVVNEAMIKGAGVFWTEMIVADTTADSQMPPMKMVGSFYDTIDNLLVDPDFDNADDQLWCARKMVRPIGEVSEQYGIPVEVLEKHYDKETPTLQRQPKDKKKKDGTNKLLTFYKIWSKTGMGDRLKDAPKENKGVFDPLGKYAYLVVCEGVPYPLNVPPEVLEEEVNAETGLPDSLLTRTAWPIPFYADPKGWPYTMLAFHRKGIAGLLAIRSNRRAEIVELVFLSPLRDCNVSETVVAVTKAADQAIKDQLLAPSGGFKIIELSELLGRKVEDIVSVFQMPRQKDLRYYQCNTRSVCTTNRPVNSSMATPVLSLEVLRKPRSRTRILV